MEAVILRAFHCDMTGVAEYLCTDTKLRIRYNIKLKDGCIDDIYKLMVLSSVRPDNLPIIADTPEFSGCHAIGERFISQNDAALLGYELRDMDTFAVVKKTEGRYELAAAGFARLSWDVDRALSGLGGSRNDPALQRACELSEAYRGNEDNEAYQKVLLEIDRIKKILKPAKHSPIADYEWYELADAEPPIAITSYRHILTDAAANQIKASGEPLLYGIGSCGMTAFAAKTTAMPFDNVLDCSVRHGDFVVAGILFTAEGQFFARLEKD